MRAAFLGVSGFFFLPPSIHSSFNQKNFRFFCLVNTYQCQCKDNYHGRHCEKILDKQNMLIPIIVSESVQFEYHPDFGNILIELTLKTTQYDALILSASNELQTKLKSLLTIAIVDGYVEVYFSTKLSTVDKFYEQQRFTRSHHRINDS